MSPLIVSWLFARAIFAFLLLPGTIAFLIPLLVIQPDWRSIPFEPLSLLLLVPGFVLLLACVREFYVSGKGTLAPWSPPIHLVTSGPYRFSRNPMYVAMSMLLIGWIWAFQTRELAWWALFMITAFHVRILLGEEPTLARSFGAEWDEYRRRVRRWVGWQRLY